MRRLCAGLYPDAVHVSLVCCIRPDRICFWCIRRDDHRPVLARVPVTRILTLQVMPYCPIRLAGPVCCPGQPHRTLVNEVSMLPPRGEVATCVFGNSWRGARVRIHRPQGLRSICLLASLDQLEAIVAFSSGYLLWT